MSRALWLVPLALGLLVASCSGDNHGNGGDGSGADTAALDGTTGLDGATGMDAAGLDGAATDAARDGADGGGSSHVVVTCPGCGCFPGTNCAGGDPDAGTTTPACTMAGQAPTLVYPPDGVLLPPNTNVVEVQWMPGAGNTLFELDFQNGATDVRIVTRCAPITNSRGVATGGCGFVLDAANWRYVAAVNRGGDPVAVTVRATPDGACVGASATRHVQFATEDLNGGIYYWQSVTVDGTPGRAGGIYRYDFGRQDERPEAFLESSPLAGNRCIGCHFVSRDGLRISYGSDDPDSDDEYGDLRSALMEVDTRVSLSANVLPGFRTFTHDHTSMLASDGRAMLRPAALARYNGNTGALTDNQPTGALRGTHPDWTADDSRVVYVQPTGFLNAMGATSATADDDHFVGGSLVTAAWDGAHLAAPTPLLTSTGENNYYPAYSPDGAFVVFDRVMGATGIAADAFSNPNARVWAMPATGGAPVDLANLNRGNGLSNSWPRFSPSVQHDRGHSIVWVTFSSIRDYGLRVQNEDPAGVSCYPPESPENRATSHMCPLVPASCGCTATTCAQFCVQPQIWMAALEIDASGGISAGRDTSHPAFWLPFQDDHAHNHTAQWVTQIPGHPGPGPDGGTDGGGTDAAATDAAMPACGNAGDHCGAGAALCCAAYSCVAGICDVP